MQFLSEKICALWCWTSYQLMNLAPVFSLIARLYIAKVFLLSGYNKISDWPSTLYLFTSEYDVPLLPPVLAAVLATIGELGLSVGLALGFKTQFSAFGLLVLNIVAVVSYYSELVSSPVAIHDHIEWGIILCLLIVSDVHQWSLDEFLRGNEGKEQRHA